MSSLPLFPARKFTMRLSGFIFCIAACLTFPVLAQEAPSKASRQDQLRGSITPEREWWDVKHYHLSVQVFPEEKRISGSNQITFEVLTPSDRMQIDLQTPLEITRIIHGSTNLPFEREGNVYWVTFPQKLTKQTQHKIDVHYEGQPTESKRPPWSGGVTWNKDPNGNHFIATTCQGIGASIWWPNKDHCYDEPDHGMDISVTVPNDLTAVCNGRLINEMADCSAQTKTFHWQVVNPINNYCVNMNIGDYVRMQETIKGERGPLDMDYWVLRHQKATAEEHFIEAPRTIEALEHWFGPYPFYEDSYKLVVVPYLGMEHQSSVTYGNGFKNGYQGKDLSGTGVGMKFDFIIVHESGHEWFGNNITAKDIADMWIQEGFTNYSENLFVNYHFTRTEAEDYVIGCRRNVKNDRPIIGTYGVNKAGSGDMYYKAGNMLHMIRNVIDNDRKWRTILRGLNETFRHSTVTTEQIENYVSDKSEIDFSSVFDQYLRDTKIPVFLYSRNDNQVTYQFQGVIEDFTVKTRIIVDGEPAWITPTTNKQTLKLPANQSTFAVDRNFYFDIQEQDADKTPEVISENAEDKTDG